MKVKPNKKIKVFNAIGMPCSSRELNDLKDGKEIALTEETAKLMQSMGLVQIIDKKSKSKEKK